uniref:sialic acid-binding Ig-like lectin 5 isoform X1 n=1 Tax=Gasterosteus aculeatus aculeatus TaxID=481459 RepID=UPI001A982829|nr:sialic acid-binding Ig-like lectin 5 isoform X1 [Gasterosteus aculeatus aculeatus]
MAAALTLLLIGSLLQGAQSKEFKGFVPQTIEVLTGSCVTIPCSFEIEDQYESNLDDTCRAIWKHGWKNVVFNSKDPQTSLNDGELTGDLTKKTCTTTLNNIQPAGNYDYLFRLECDNGLKYDFAYQKVLLSVKDVPPRPTLTPSALKVEEGASVSLSCSAPAPCLSHPPTVTWTKGLGDIVETLQENEDRTKVLTSYVTFTASHKHHGETISCEASYHKQNGSAESAATLTADVSYSPKVTTVSVRPSGPVLEDSSVTLTCSSTANPAVKNYTWYRADGEQKTFIGTGRVLTIKASKEDSPFLCKAQNDVGVGRSNNTHIDVQYAAQILLSSDCITAGDQLNCSCWTLGNPPPTVRWYLNGSPVNHSEELSVSSERLNDTTTRSIITVNRRQEAGLSSLLCRSVNSRGSATQRFCVGSSEPQKSAQSPDRVMLTVFISVVVALLVLVCALLFVIRAQKTHHDRLRSQCTGDTSTVTAGPLLGGEGQELPNNAEGASRGSEKTSEEGKDVVYSTVNWRTRSQKKAEASEESLQPGGSYLEEEMCTAGGTLRGFVSSALEMEGLYGNVGPRNVKKEVGSEYAQVKFKDKRGMHK